MKLVTKILRKGQDFQVVIFASYPQEDGSFYDVEVMTLAKYYSTEVEALETINSKEFKPFLKSAKIIESLTR